MFNDDRDKIFYANELWKACFMWQLLRLKVGSSNPPHGWISLKEESKIAN